MIHIVDYRPTWPQDYAALADAIREAVGDHARRIDHIGSTSVPGLCAKDVIDIQVTVASLDEVVANRLRAAGFVRRAQVSGDHVPPGASGPREDWMKFLFYERPGTRRANIHVREAGRPNQRYPLLFRDYLRASPEMAEAYARLKRMLASSLKDPDSYPDVKDPAVDLIYFAAKAWAAKVGWGVDGQ